MCRHASPCPDARSIDHNAAVVVADHSEQGWVLRCNGVVSFDDGADLDPDGQLLPRIEHQLLLVGI